jgi:uncharacterized delta-60 repeat protein
MKIRTTLNRAVAVGFAAILALLTLPGTAHLQATPPGQVDLSFDAGSITVFGTPDILAILVQPDGKILIGGLFTQVQGVTRNGLARLHPDGSLDTSFVPPFPVAATLPTAHAFVLQPDGKILVGGQGLNVGGIPYKIARLNPDGSLDPSFTLQEMAGGIQAVALMADGRILIGGGFSNIGPVTARTMARLLPDGTLDPSFDLEPTTDEHGGAVRTIVVQPDGNFLVGGDFRIVVGAQAFELLARIRPDATIDTSFNPVFSQNGAPFVRAIVLRPDGSMYVGGNFGTIDGLTLIGLARLSAAGTPDPAFSTNGALGAYYDLALQPFGKLLVTGDFFLPPNRWGIARLDPSGAFDSFSPPFGLGPGVGHSMAVQADGKVLVGGLFHNPGGVPRVGIVRLLNDPPNAPPNAVDDLATTAEDLAVTVNVVANDTDPDGDPLTVSVVTPAAHGTTAVSGAGSVTYTPDPNYQGSDAFTYTVDDGKGGTDTATVTVTITPVNDPPVALAQSVVTSEDVALSIGLTATDADGDALTFSVLTAPLKGTLSGPAPNLTYTPAPNVNGADSFTFRVHDGTVFSNVATVSIVIAPANDPPVAQDDGYTTQVNVPLTIAAPGVLANDTDVDGGALSAAVVSPPATGTIVLNPDGSFTYTPAPGFTGTATFTYAASDGIATSNVATVSIAIAVPIVKIVGTGDPVPGGTGLFTGFPHAPAVSGSLIALRGLGTAGQQGVYGCGPGDPCVPIANLGTLIPGGTGTFTGLGAPATAGGLTSFIGTGASQAGVYSCDRAIPTDPCVALASLGTAIPGGTGTFTGFTTPSAAGHLTSFIGTGAGQAGVYTCTPGDPCAPIANLDTEVPGGAGTFTSFTDLGLAVDISQPGPPPMVAFIGSGAGQQGVYSCDRTIPTEPCQPVANLETEIPGGAGTFTGFDRVALALDTSVATPEAIVAFIGTGAGQQGVYQCAPTEPCAPVASLSTAIPGGAGTFTGFSAVSTSRGHTAFLAEGSFGQAGIYVASTLQKVVAVGDTLAGQTVAALRFGRDGLDGNRLAFAATFADGSEGVFLAELSLVANAAPFAIDDAATTSEDVGTAIHLVANDSDPDGDALTVTALTPPAHGTVVDHGNGTVTYTPHASYNGTDAFTYTVVDGRGGTDTAAVTVTITPVNDAPVAAPDSYTTSQNTTLTVAAPGILANDSDVEGHPLSAALMTSPTHGAVTLAADGSFVYVPAAGYSGPDSFTYRASDGAATSNTATVSLDVTAVSNPTWRPTGGLNIPRAGHTATRLVNGRVLVVGGLGINAATTAELYDPATGVWTRTGNLNRARVDHTATLLPNGRVLVAGSSAFSSRNAIAKSAEVYDPATGAWTLTGSLRVAHGRHTATLLLNGKVLVAGGSFAQSGGIVLQASPPELFDPATGTWSPAGTLPDGRIGHQATLLASGRVLVTGGSTVSLLPSVLRRTDVYDPATGTWARSGDLTVARFLHTATLLPNGRVLAAGGAGPAVPSGTSEQYDPVTGAWTQAASMAPRTWHTAVRLPSGKVLVAAGLNGRGLPTRTAVLFAPLPGTWRDTGSLATARILHTLTELGDGRVLVAGGTSGLGFLGSVEIYGP